MAVTDITLNFRVTSIAESANGRFSIGLSQDSDDNPAGAPTYQGPGPTTTNIFLTEEQARTVFPGDLYTMTFVKATA